MPVPDLDRLLNDHAGFATVQCGRCGHEQLDVDNLGSLDYCSNCHYCQHPARANGVCVTCGDGPRSS